MLMTAIGTLSFAFSLAGIAAGDEAIEFASGSAFRRALEQSISASWDNDDLRGIALGIERTEHVSIVLDRRLDPSALRSLRVGGETVLRCLQQLAAESDAGVAVIGNTAYLGPRGTAGKLRTLLALRRKELFEKHGVERQGAEKHGVDKHGVDKQGEIPDARRMALTHVTTFRWNDLDRPADLVARLAREYALAVEGIDQVPHDLWAAAVLPEASALEALTLLLAQFDLTFAWMDQGRGIRIEPVPDRVEIDRIHNPPRGMTAAAALDRWKEEIPDLEARVENGKIVVSGTEELHEVVDRVRRGGRAIDKTLSQEGPKPKPLNLYRTSGKILNVPASAVLKDLESPEKGQLTFEYDRAAFKAAGIDLDKRVSFELKNATIEVLLKASLDPLGVTFEIHGRTVTLKPAVPNE